MVKKWLSYIFPCILVPAAVLLGATVFKDKQYAWISLCVAVLSCVPFFLAFEKGKSGTKEMILIAVMVALSAVGRLIFAWAPSVKPVTALVIITAMYFGPQAGFMTGALTAVISNFYFGQGPWTPFQMFSWGIVGLIAGVFAPQLKKSLVFRIIYSAVSGVLYSLLMDIYTTLWYDGTFNLTRYIAAVTSAVPVTLTYVVSNVVFIIVLAKPIGSVLDRIKTKYGMK